MALTRDFKQTVVERVRRDPAFARALLDEAATLFLNGEPDAARRAGHRAGADDEEEEGAHMKKSKKGRVGSSFDEFLKEDGIYEEVTSRAIKRVLARQLAALMKDQDLTKSALARKMRTSRAQLDRVLDPDNESVTLDTLTRAAKAVGRQLRMELV